MTTYKEALRDDILTGMSPELLAAIETAKFGDVETVPIPTTVDEAILVTGQVNVNFSQAILAPLAGTPIVEAILRNAQLNMVFLGLLYASLEITGNGIIQMLKPVDGQVFYGFLDEFICVTVPDGATSVTVEQGTDTFDLTQQEDRSWCSLWAVPLGSHTATITATWPDGFATAQIAFSVVPWPTFPVEAAEYTPEEVDHFEIVEPRASSVMVETYSGTYTMEQQEDGTWVTTDFDPSGNPGTGIAQALFEMTIDGETIEHIIHFLFHEV